LEAITKLCAILELSKDIYPTKEELSPSSKIVTPESPKSEIAAVSEQPKRLDETIPGGRYQTADGRFVNANGEEID
jgi:hypothetical protein